MDKNLPIGVFDSGIGGLTVLYKLIEMLISLGIFTKVEIESRYEILLETYCKTIHVEVKCQFIFSIFYITNIIIDINFFTFF